MFDRRWSADPRDRDDERWRHEYDGHPDRDAREIAQWALEHELPYFDDHAHFPDVAHRIRGAGRPSSARRRRVSDCPLSRWACRGGRSFGLHGLLGIQRANQRARRWWPRRRAQWRPCRGAAALTFEAAVAAVGKFGITERQARFLVTMMLHGGLCIPRQFATFAGTAYGHKMGRLFARLARC
jgi:hypothetical protein